MPSEINTIYCKNTAKNPLYRKWLGMMHRCYKPHKHDFKYYGGRGIEVCKEWHKFENFVNAMVSTYKQGLTLDRVDNDGDYEKSNCRWATHKQQCNNRSTSNKFENPEDGRLYSVSQISEKYGLPRPTVNNRVMRGYTEFCQLSYKGDIRTHNVKHGHRGYFSGELRAVRD